MITHRPIQSSLRGRCNTIALIVAGCATMIACYATIIAPEYLYPEMDVAALSPLVWGACALIFLSPAFFIPLHISRPSDFAAWILYLNVVLPISLIHLMLNDADAQNVLFRISVIVGAFLTFEFLRRRSPISPQKGVEAPMFFSVLLPLMMFFLALLVWYLAGFRIDLSFVNVYDRRAAARDVIEAGSIMGYTMGGMSGCLVPVGLVLGIYYRQRIHLLLVVAITIAVFSFNGTKGSILIPLALIPVMFWARSKRNIGTLMCAAIVGLMLATLLEFHLLRSDILANFFVRRQFVLPGLLTQTYWDFFSENPYVLMSDGFLCRFIEPRYEANVARLMGAEVFGSFDCNANANLWASGFAHFGYVGMFAVSVIAAGLMWVVDSLANSGRFIVASVIAAEMALIWTNGSLHTSLFSNGLIAAVAVLYVFPARIDRMWARPQVARTWLRSRQVRRVPAVR